MCVYAVCYAEIENFPKLQQNYQNFGETYCIYKV